MKYEDGRATGLNIAYIGGGSSGWAWTFMTDLALDGSLAGTIRLYDLNEEAARRNAAIGNRLSARPGVKGRWEYVTCSSLAQALEGADFAVISILPGTFEEMASDVHMPERLGIYQSVGDTTGPGGIIRAMRTLPMFAEIGLAVKKYAPDAWVINYTNPMAAGVRTLYEVFPAIKAFGHLQDALRVPKCDPPGHPGERAGTEPLHLVQRGLLRGRGPVPGVPGLHRQPL